MSRYLTGRSAVRVAIAVFATVGLVLGVDLLLGYGKTARGGTIAGLGASVLTPTQTRALINELHERSKKPVTVLTDSGTAEIDPADLGLSFDAEATQVRLLQQPKNPVDRIAALVGIDQPVDPVVSVDRASFDAALEASRSTLEKAAVEGGVRFVDAVPVGSHPAGGLRINRDAAVRTQEADWLNGTPVELPMEPFSPTVTAETVQATVLGPAAQAMSGAVELRGANKVKIRLTPKQLGSFLVFVPDGKGGLVPKADEKAAKKLLAPRLASTERKAVDAGFTISGGSPTVVPARDGSTVAWETTLAAVASAAVGSGERVAEVTYDVLEPKLTTDAAGKLGVKELISEYTTGDFSSASGENIRLVAKAVDGALILPGEKFSLNSHTGPRGAAQGYVTSTIIDNGHASKAVGGGISQFATTLYNAAYFAGLQDVEHTEHAYYISRYPEAREATVFEGAIDLVIGNNTKHGVFVETSWSPRSVTVRLWGTKAFEVQSVPGERRLYTTPKRIELPKGDDCIASRGSRGFTTSDTRIVTDVATGAEVDRHTRTVKYDPEPIVRCV